VATEVARPRESPLGITVRGLLRQRSSRVALILLGVIVLIGLRRLCSRLMILPRSPTSSVSRVFHHRWRIPLEPTLTAGLC